LVYLFVFYAYINETHGSIRLNFHEHDDEFNEIQKSQKHLHWFEVCHSNSRYKQYILYSAVIWSSFVLNMWHLFISLDWNVRWQKDQLHCRFLHSHNFYVT
jgi:hypothetical protein